MVLNRTRDWPKAWMDTSTGQPPTGEPMSHAWLALSWDAELSSRSLPPESLLRCTILQVAMGLTPRLDSFRLATGTSTEQPTLGALTHFATPEAPLAVARSSKSLPTASSPPSTASTEMMARTPYRRSFRPETAGFTVPRSTAGWSGLAAETTVAGPCSGYTIWHAHHSAFLQGRDGRHRWREFRRPARSGYGWEFLRNNHKRRTG